MKKTIVYVDGSNLYYGLLRGTSDKWLDLVSFARGLLRDEHEIVSVKYFASRVIDKTPDHHRSERQDKYLDALRNWPLVKVIEGYYREQGEWLEPVKEPCKSCEAKTRPGKVRVSRTTEKLTDVNLATELLQDAYERRADSFVLISGDSDLAPAIRVLRYRLKVPVLVFNPQRSVCNELRKYSTYYKNLAVGCTHDHQMPASFANAEGRTIHRPAAW